ncbi:MAG: hypothetical protein K1X74_08205 [Pirellulales bacterium]|nr:hypothetical protein [Pirellulales bacterium]
MNALPGAQDRPWYITDRWQQYEGELRANLLRTIGIGGFYTVELINYHGLRLGGLELPKVEGVDGRFHLAVTVLCAAWSALALGVYSSLRQQYFPPAFKFVTTAADMALLTGLLTIAAGPRSPLLVVYFLLILLAGLRFSLSLVWFATGCALAGYLFLLGYARWYAPQPETVIVPRYYQLIFLLALMFSGVLLGQLIRRVRGIAADYARRQEADVARLTAEGARP